MTTQLPRRDWRSVTRQALQGAELTQALAQAPGWQAVQSGGTDAIERTFSFADYHETMAFVNAVAFIAHTQDHHPDLTVSYNRCTVRFNTHDAGGVSESDLDCARRVNALLQL